MFERKPACCQPSKCVGSTARRVILSRAQTVQLRLLTQASVASHILVLSLMSKEVFLLQHSAAVCVVCGCVEEKVKCPVCLGCHGCTPTFRSWCVARSVADAEAHRGLLRRVHGRKTLCLCSRSQPRPFFDRQRVRCRWDEALLHHHGEERCRQSYAGM